MRTIHLAFICFFICNTALCQKDYPIPEATPTRLFYIQHSKNHNTYVYDAKMEGESINMENPIDEYRIVYTEGGIRKPLNKIQKQLAYGMLTKLVAPNLYEMHLAGSEKLKFYLALRPKEKPKVFVTINKRKLYLDRMFIKLFEGGSPINVKAEYILFSGEDFTTGKNIMEKLIVE